MLSSAVLEVRAFLYSRGLSFQQVAEAFSLMEAKLAEYGVGEFTPFTMSNVVLAEHFRRRYPELTFFDSLHAATSQKSGVKLLSSEKVYERMGVLGLDLERL